MAFDFKREDRRLYLPGKTPELVKVPPMRFAAVRGQGDPNAPDGPYPRAVAALYAVAYTVKMSKMGERRIDGYFDFVVPPLEGFWRQPGSDGFDRTRKDAFEWVACIRMPDFVTAEDFRWAIETAARKRGVDAGVVALMDVDEGLCVQMMHLGPYDDEPASVARMDAFVAEQGLVNDFSDKRWHHEIYLSDPRRTAPEKLRTVIRHPVARR